MSEDYCVRGLLYYWVIVCECYCVRPYCVRGLLYEMVFVSEG